MTSGDRLSPIIKRLPGDAGFLIPKRRRPDTRLREFPKPYLDPKTGQWVRRVVMENANGDFVLTDKTVPAENPYSK